MAFITDRKTKLDVPQGEVWYHGSPLELGVLKAASSITRNRALAEAFAHRPTLLSFGDDGVISHNGTEDGFLYAVDEEVRPEDIRVHGACREDDPWEWVTTRDLRLRLVEELPAVPRQDDP